MQSLRGVYEVLREAGPVCPRCGEKMRRKIVFPKLTPHHYSVHWGCDHPHPGVRVDLCVTPIVLASSE